MEETESQIAKIQLGNPKQTKSFVFAMAEKAQGNVAELFLIIELPLSDSETSAANENICLTVATAFRKVYKKPLEENSFENAISQINEDLGLLASAGQTRWIDKIHAIVAVKQKNTFQISSCGKVAAFLLRDGEFTDISCSGQTTHPLKTFDTFASGKIRLNDLLILSTTQMFNYLSIDRFKDLVLSGNFLRATQTVIQLLKDNAGQNIAFGTILNLQVPVGMAGDEELDLEEFVSQEETEISLVEKIFTQLKKIGHFRNFPKMPNMRMPKIGSHLKNLGGAAKNAAGFSKTAFGAAKKQLSASKEALSWQKVKSYSPQKKFFFASVLALLVVVITNIALAVHYKNIQKNDHLIFSNIQEAKSLLSKASDSLLYKNESVARDFFQTAMLKLPKEGFKISSRNKAEYEQVKPLLEDLKQKMEKVLNVAVENLGSLSSGQVLLSLPGALGTESAGNITAYELGSKKILDGAFKSPGQILEAILLNTSQMAIFSQKGLILWTVNENKISQAFTQNIPTEKDFGGLAFYEDNKKIYILDKSLGKIFSFVSSSNGFSKPTLTVSDEKLKNAQSLSLDGNIYALDKENILKFTKGKPQKFTLPFLLNPFSGEGKIYTQKNFKNIYILDISQKRIIILDKKGSLMATIKNPTFTNLKDFTIDENAKTIYLLNDVSLLKMALP